MYLYTCFEPVLTEMVALCLVFSQGPSGDQGPRGEAGAKGDKVKKKKKLNSLWENPSRENSFSLK